MQPFRNTEPRRLRVSQVNKIFITHMHADHTMGLLTVLRNVLGIPKPPSATAPNTPLPNVSPPRVEIFGPRGVRRMLRTLWYLTHTHSEHPYAVHELLLPGERPSVSADVQSDTEQVDEVDVRRESECVGRDIWCDEEGFWRGILNVPPNRHKWGALVDAGPIQHRDPCVGYIIREIPQYDMTPTSPLPRKVVLLGDTYDPSPIIPLIHADPPYMLSSPDALPELDPTESGFAVRVPVSLLVHEATDAYLPPSVDPYERTGRNRTQASVESKTRERGHSTPAMAGAFARRIAAERLVLNHIGARFPAPDVPPSRSGQDKFRLACMREIERQAAQTWSSPSRRRVYPQAAWDFLTISIPPNPPRVVEEVGAPSEALLDELADAREETDTVDGQMQLGRSGMPGQSELETNIEMEESLILQEDSTQRAGVSRDERRAGRTGLQSAVPLTEEHSSRLTQTYGMSAENKGVRHDQQYDRKRDRDGSASRSDRQGGSGSEIGGGEGRGRYESRRGYGTWSSGHRGGRGDSGGAGRGDGGGGGRGGHGGRGRGGGGYGHKRLRGRGG
ncbi:beta-lactamase-like protein [Trametes punicea]|nr:beta-lactamase-like protein [Trametes punicea]